MGSFLSDLCFSHRKDPKFMSATPDYTLGPLPWSEGLLRKAFFRDFINTEKAIREHPGFPAHSKLLALQQSLNIFLDAVSEFFSSIKAFQIDAESPLFWTRPFSETFNKRELAIRRGVFAAATTAMALVDHSRRVKNTFSAVREEYDNQIGKVFDEHEHRFVQCLRDCVCHIRMIESDWQTTYSASGKNTQFLLRRVTLLGWNGWNAHARTFIDRNPDGIDIERLFTVYRQRVQQFQEWFQIEVAKASEPELSEYREYEKTLKRFGVRATWNLILDQFVIGRLDPFLYLNKYLTKAELKDVMALPMKSIGQVDRIIQILDDYGACDDELRRKVYRAFGIILCKVDVNGQENSDIP